ncbi:MAG: hypothetical protein AB7P40_20700 [Chloroflexota bacterium]
MNEIDAAIDQAVYALYGTDEALSTLDMFDVTPYVDDDDSAFDRWLAALSATNFEHVLHGIIGDSASMLLPFERTA